MLARGRAGHVAPPRPAVADPITASVPEPGPGGHLAAVDVVRFVTVAGVILVHATALTISYGSLAAGAVYDVAHVTRSVFLMLSAFVLTYSFQRRPLHHRAFWRKRFPLVVVPYATWSLIYVLTDGDLGTPQHVVATYFYDLATGGAHFHLYFLLLTMQMYAIFPALMALLRRFPRAVTPLLLVALAFQMAVTACIHYDSWPGAFGIWINHAGTWLISYSLFVLGGIAAAQHFDTVTTWIRRRYRLVAISWVASVAVALVSYLLDMSYLGYSPLKASEVFQPALVFETVTATAAQFALGLWLADRLPDRYLRRLEHSSDVSFGVYLAHPLLIGAVLDVAVAAGAWNRLGGLPSGIGEALVAFALVPFIYAATFKAVAFVRRTPASMPLTGRRRSSGASSRPSAPGPATATEGTVGTAPAS